MVRVADDICYLLSSVVISVRMPVLCNLSVRKLVKLCTLGVYTLEGELGFLNCDDICVCVVNKQFELIV